MSFLDVSLMGCSIDNLCEYSHFESPENIPCAKIQNASDSSPKTNLTRNAVAHFISHNQSYKCLEDVTHLINTTPGAQIRIPNTKHRIKRQLHPFFTPIFHIQCAICKTYSATITAESECAMCSIVIKRAHSNYFVAFPLKAQLVKSITDHFHEIVAYHQRLGEPANLIRDVHDGIQYKKLKSCYPDCFLLPLAVNTDGARVFNTTNKSMWPIQIYQNFLPPNVRYVPDNIIVTAIYEGEY